VTTKPLPACRIAGSITCFRLIVPKLSSVSHQAFRLPGTGTAEAPTRLRRPLLSM
jgi:hypothetical protein